ncbi:MAG: NAD(P)-dependent oxidoreductase [Chloroflexota bacterium]
MSTAGARTDESPPKADATLSVRDVAFIGTGLMGAHMARRLGEAKLHVVAWNRSPAKAYALEPSGVKVAEDPVEAVRHADVVFCMLSDAAAVEEVIFGSGLAEALRPGSTVVDMSSIDPVSARQHASRLGDIGVEHMDAPVSGGTSGAKAGTLAIMVGGSKGAFDRLTDLLGILGTPRYIGNSGSGQLAKLTNQIIVGITICAVAEGILFAARAGADPAAVIGSLKGGFAESRVLNEHGARMLEHAFEPGGPVRLQLKDLRTALEVARREGVQLPATEIVTHLYEELARHDGADLDHSALLLEIERINDPMVSDRGS